MTNEYNPDGKEIRFIDSHYKDLFHIPDGSCVQIHYPDEMVVKPCTFIDEYHTQIGYNVFHICQFAEIMERNGASYMPEPEIMGDEAAWKVGKDRILAVQTCEDGYDYTLLDENYNEIDGGQVDNPELSMLEVRRDILESFGLERRELRAMFYEDVMEQAFEVGRQAVVVNDPIAELAFKLDRFAENFDPYEYMDQVDDVQAHIQEIKADLAAGNTAPYREFLNTAMVRAPFGALRKTVSPSAPRQRECTKPWKAALLTWMVPSSTVWEWRWRIFCPDRPPQFPETVMILCPTKKTALWNIYCRMLTIRCIMMSCIIVTGICSGQSMRMPLSTACCGRSAAAPSTSVTKLGTQIRMC